MVAAEKPLPCALCDGASVAPVGAHGPWLISVPAPSLISMPGWLLVHSAEHRETLDGIDADWWHDLGPALDRARRLVRLALAVDKVYVVSFGEDLPHAHAAVVGVTKEQRQRWRGPEVILHRGEFADAEAAARFVAAVHALAGQTGS